MSGSGDFSIGGRVWPGLSKVIEETGELGQVIGKLIATHGGADHWDGTDLGDRLHDELGDVIGAIGFLIEANGLDRHRITARAEQKIERFRQWHEAQAS